MDKTTRLSNTFALDVLANMKSALVVVDKIGKVLVINESAGRILGVDDVAQTVGLDCREVFERIPYLSELLLSSGDFKTLPDRAELEIRDSSDSGRRVIGYSLSPVHNDQKERLGTALFFKDLTDVEREETKERIRDRLVALGEMAAWMAHEIRNPLASIEVAAGLLIREETDPSRREHSKDIFTEVKRLNRIITQTLDFVRSRPVNLEECDINTLLVDIMEESLKGRGDIEYWHSFTDFGRVLLDRSQIAQALRNIIKNSCEAMPSGGVLVVSTHRVPSDVDHQVPEIFNRHVIRERENLVVEIKDTGVGMPEEVRNKIFTPFFTTKSGGTGIGMSLAQKVITEHWGFLDVESSPGDGTKFKVILPILRTKD